MSYTWTTTSDSSISGLNGVTISSMGNVVPSYSINLGGTSLETDDIEFIHSLQKAGSNGDVSAALAQLIEEYKYTWNTSTFTGNMTQKNTQEKESESMDIMKNFHFGPCGDRAKISPIGIAIKNSNGEWVSYDKEKSEIVNVDLINFGNSNFVYMIPVAIKDVAEGDAVIHNKHIMFVKKVKGDGIAVVDVTDGEYKKILPTKSMFGFDFMTKVVSLIEFAGIEASADNPFGNLLPFLLMNGEEDNSDALPLTLMMMNSGMNGGIFPSDISPLVMMMALKNNSTAQAGSSMSTILPLMMLMNQKKES